MNKGYNQLLCVIFLSQLGTIFQLSSTDPWSIVDKVKMPSQIKIDIESRLNSLKAENEALSRDLSSGLENIKKKEEEIREINRDLNQPIAEEVQIALVIAISNLEEEVRSIKEVVVEFKRHIERNEKDIAFLIAEERALENEMGDVISIVCDYESPSPMFEAQAAYKKSNKEKINYKDVNAEIVQLVSLQQSRSANPIEAATNYCGYYALYNAFCLSKNIEKEMLDRILFSKLFEFMLLRVKSTGKRAPFEYLSPKEIRDFFPVLGIQKEVALIEVQNLFTFAVLGVDLTNAIESEAGAQLIRDFQQKKIGRLVIVLGLGAREGHWLTVLAEWQSDGSILFKVADSLHKSSWYEQSKIESAIIPLYFALTGQWKYLTSDLANKAGFIMPFIN